MKTNFQIVFTAFALAIALLPESGHCFYNTSTGRWLNRDPILEKGVLPIFAFVSNNPISSLDPFGKLSLTYVNGSLDLGYCGSFHSWIVWSLDNNNGYSDPISGGTIVQLVNVAFNITYCDKASSPYQFGPPSSVTLDPANWPLYEAWYIPPNKSHPVRSGAPAVDDNFMMPEFGMGTKGSITINASASYFDAEPIPFGFIPTFRPPTGSLPTSTSFFPPAEPTSTVTRTVTASWDCCCRRQKTRVTRN